MGSGDDTPICLKLAHRGHRRWRYWAVLLAACLMQPTAWACTGPAVELQPLGRDLWWVPGTSGDADASNRGQVSNLLIGRDGTRVWALGTGPSPRFGEELACAVRETLGQPITDVIAPWPRPELVLGQAGMPGVRRWAHADVAAGMARRCPTCVERLKLRLGEAAADLGESPIRLPDRHVNGASGRLGPWRWWRFGRAPGVAVTVWQWQSRPDLVIAHGLIWGDGAPDGRDANAADLARVMQQLRQRLPRPAADAASGGRRWLGEQGPPVDEDRVDQHRRYWPALRAAADAAVTRGDDETAAAPPLDGLPDLSQGRLHALNWQRAWRQSEERSFQRSRR